MSNINDLDVPESAGYMGTVEITADATYIMTDNSGNVSHGTISNATEEIGGTLELQFDDDGNLSLITDAEEGDLLYDEIGSVLKIKKLQKEKAELFEQLETYFKVFFLGEDA